MVLVVGPAFILKNLSMKPFRTGSSLLALTLAPLPCCAQVTTSQYDNFRTGATLNEKILTPQNVNSKQFGKLGAFKVDGAVYAQPLFLPGVEIPGQDALVEMIKIPGGGYGAMA